MVSPDLDRSPWEILNHMLGAWRNQIFSKAFNFWDQQNPYWTQLYQQKERFYIHVYKISVLFCLTRKRVEYLRNLVFYHRAKGEHPERKKNIKITNKTTPEKTGVRSMPVCQSAVLILILCLCTLTCTYHKLYPYI